jgi:hypothetical protein
VPANDLASLLGHRCQLMVNCTVCGGVHVHEGTVSLARQPGEIEVGGHAYPVGQVRAVVTLPEPDGFAIPRRVFDLAFLGGLALVAFNVFRFWL